MSSNVDERDFSEDLFEHTRMSFWDHIEELRTHLWRALYGFFIAMCFSFLIGQPVLHFIQRPVKDALDEIYDRRARNAMFGKTKEAEAEKPTPFFQIAVDPEQFQAVLKGKPAEEVNQLPQPVTSEEKANYLDSNTGVLPPGFKEIGESALYKIWIRIENPLMFAGGIARAGRHVNRDPTTLVGLSVMEGFVIYLKVCVYLGVLLASPWIFYQVWSFIAAGLYPQEKKLVNVYLPFSIALFFAGAMVAEFIVLKYAVRYLLAFNEWVGLEPDLRLSEWLSFAILTPLVFGLAFQLPLIMLFLYKLGIMDVEMYRKHRRIAIFVMAVITVIAAPAPDPVSFGSLLIPLWGLYELGILLCAYSPRPKYEEEEPDQQAMVEV